MNSELLIAIIVASLIAQAAWVALRFFVIERLSTWWIQRSIRKYARVGEYQGSLLSIEMAPPTCHCKTCGGEHYKRPPLCECTDCGFKHVAGPGHSMMGMGLQSPLA